MAVTAAAMISDWPVFRKDSEVCECTAARS
jgi:hypothetical protein